MLAQERAVPGAAQGKTNDHGCFQETSQVQRRTSGAQSGSRIGGSTARRTGDPGQAPQTTQTQESLESRRGVVGGGLDSKIHPLAGGAGCPGTRRGRVRPSGRVSPEGLFPIARSGFRTPGAGHVGVGPSAVRALTPFLRGVSGWFPCRFDPHRLRLLSSSWTSPS